MTPLVLHYAPGLLAVLKREPCRGRYANWGSIGHAGCGCYGKGDVFLFVSASEVLDGERPLQLCWIPKTAAELEQRQRKQVPA